MNHHGVERIRSFFLKAAGQCYAGDLPKTTIAELPKSKVYTYEEGDFLYRDVYFKNGDGSGGQTTIFQDWMPVWLMQYHGWNANDDPNTIAFLKTALRETYCSGIWNLGRGPSRFTHPDFPNLKYTVEKSQDTDFEQIEAFGGWERIYEGDSTIFWHRFQGWMIESIE